MKKFLSISITCLLVLFLAVLPVLAFTYPVSNGWWTPRYSEEDLDDPFMIWGDDEYASYDYMEGWDSVTYMFNNFDETNLYSSLDSLFWGFSDTYYYPPYMSNSEDPWRAGMADSFMYHLSTIYGERSSGSGGGYTEEDLDEAWQQGKELGYSQGYEAGKLVGVDEGITDAEIFFGSLRLVLEAPVVFINDSLNFEIFGLNIAAFVKFIITGLLAAWLVKMLLKVVI